MTEWRKFLIEGTVEYSGILKIKPSHIVVSELEAIQAMLPEEGVRLSPEDFHVTLIHQSILKSFQKEIKNIEFPLPPPIVLADKIFEKIE